MSAGRAKGTSRMERMTCVPNELYDYWLAVLKPAELRVLYYLARRTYGWRKDSDQVSVSQICNGIERRNGSKVDLGTGLGRRSVQRSLRTLVARGLITEHDEFSSNGRQLPNIYAINRQGLQPPEQNNGDIGDAPGATQVARGGVTGDAPGAVPVTPTTDKSSTDNSSTDNSSTHAEGVNGSAGLSHELEEKGTSWYDYARVQAPVWKCKLDHQRLRSIFRSRLEPCSGLLTAIDHALIAHAGQDATESVIRTVKMWEKHGVARAWNPASISTAIEVVDWKDNEQVKRYFGTRDIARLMWSFARGQSRPMWQRQAIADFIKSLEDFGWEQQEFIESILTLLDCCRWNGPPDREALAPKLELLWDALEEFPNKVIDWAILDYLGLEDDEGVLVGVTCPP